MKRMQGRREKFGRIIQKTRHGVRLCPSLRLAWHRGPGPAARAPGDPTVAPRAARACAIMIGLAQASSLDTTDMTDARGARGTRACAWRANRHASSAAP